MHPVDYIIFGLYMAGVLAVGYYHFRRNKNKEDYYIGSRSLKSRHVALSIVATDVGGGFSIGLGGLGFVMGLSGSWLLFTGLVGAWLTAVFIIPVIKKVDKQQAMFTYPDFLRFRFNNKVAAVAALISGIGYLGFTGAQVLAGAKLASATLIPGAPFGMDPVFFAVLIIAFITILYTVIGGLKAVVYTDYFQWVILLAGLLLFAIPLTLIKLGGFSTLTANLPSEFFSLTNIAPVEFFNWMITIIPIWLIAMTLYQRMYACRTEKEAKRAWLIAGVFEYPIMAFAGVFLGMCARVFFPEADPEMGMPLLIREVLPFGIAGIVIAAYFSAIMSTADSCLMASSGNFVNDIAEKYLLKRKPDEKTLIRLSRFATLLIGIVSVVIAVSFTTVLDAILYAYSFMVAGLFVPTLGAYFWKKSSSTGALWGMLGGGTLTVLLETGAVKLPSALASTGISSVFFGILFSALLFITLSLKFPGRA
ncbi:MAG TPA: sodium:solute symporter family protein [bacterium]|nr:sodium:solute symporter family protein [bacterium]